MRHATEAGKETFGIASNLSMPKHAASIARMPVGMASHDCALDRHELLAACKCVLSIRVAAVVQQMAQGSLNLPVSMLSTNRSRDFEKPNSTLRN